MSAQKKTARATNPNRPDESTKPLGGVTMSTQTITPAPVPPEGFTQSKDSAYWDGPEVTIQTESCGLIGAMAQWSKPTGITYALDMGWDDLTGTELLRLGSELIALVQRCEYPAVAS